MSIEKNLSNLVINKVENQAVYEYMKSKNLINSDELYFVSGADEVATETTDGLMSAEDKIKLDGIEEGAEANVIVGVQKNGADLIINSSTRKVNIIVPTKTSDLTNDSNFATTTDLDAKVDKVTGKGLSANDYTTEEKTKLSNIEDGANKTVVDTALSSTSTNPVQNKVINTKFNTIQSNIDNKVPTSRTVNGKALTGNITLSASDVGALPSSTTIPSIEGLATETYVNNKVAGLIDSAPSTLDTLNELAAALGDDPNFATTIAAQIGEKVDKVAGKALSSNDFTNDYKTKLDSLSNPVAITTDEIDAICNATIYSASEVSV